MKYYIGMLISLIGLYVFGTILKTDYVIPLKIVFSVAFFITAFLWEYSVLNKSFESEFKIRSQKKTINLFDIGMATFWTLYILLWSDFRESFSYLIFVFWVIPLNEFIMWFIYKKKKPFTIFIKDNELILNKRWILKRNLNELTQIQYDRWSKNLKLDFKTKREISIKSTEYKTEEIQKLLEILIEKSENNVFVPNNYKPNIKNS
ncbi:hypothetical protein LRR18_14860 [Mangrovimonas sp. AS39]|uniref:hypothetical protein n=1 Tax=Mangrovimonas futianensis TaxID=2895523 RepID=UPI001E4E8CEA|nr:hypothetical protein [Mangrovimonas futianensis]MCF1192873.1 hypothetical protein [Mangrovimonas futianensis]MCF1196525.1 hypothetical protein [Mangrovimonas futianensis]